MVSSSHRNAPQQTRDSSGRVHRVALDLRPHPVTGMVERGVDAKAIVVLVSSAPLGAPAAAREALRRQLGSLLGVAAFEDLWATRRADTDPLTVFDTRVLAARLSSITDGLANDPRFGRLPIGYLALGCAAAAAVVAAVDRPGAVGALVLVEATLVAASAALPELTAPTLLLQTDHDDGGFLPTAPPDGRRMVRVLRPGRPWGPRHLDAVALHARQWFRHHLVVEPSSTPTGR